MQQPPLSCASCTADATCLVVVPDLFQMVVPFCESCRSTEAPTHDSYPLASPDADDVLATHTVLRGFVVPR